MKKRFQGIVMGIAICLLFSNLGVLAKTGSETIKAWYSNIKLCVNGEYVTPTDVDGNVVEPFIVDGTTYLPVRAVGNALGIEVDWDDNTKTVYLGEKPETEKPSTDTSSTIDKYVNGLTEIIESKKREGIIIEVSTDDDTLIYTCIGVTSLSDEEIEEATFFAEENIHNYEADIASAFSECPQIQSIVVIYKDANGTLILKKEFNR